jgi:hypothetical protein
MKRRHDAYSHSKPIQNIKRIFLSKPKISMFLKKTQLRSGNQADIENWTLFGRIG